MTDDIRYMRRCIQLAKNGLMSTAPNPMVGAVVVCNGRIIGEGYHVRCGEAHAEVHALASVRPEDEPLLSHSTIYVSLEPCSHYGKTPPCADLIIRKGIKRCVVGTIDPFSEVQGRGIQKLRDAGIEVIVGVCEDECRELNKRFFTYHQLHRPFITLKWAQTSDGYISLPPSPSQRGGERLLISNSFTQMLCHKRRAEHEAILVGRRTWKLDQPRLDVRHWTGPNPRRYVLSHATGDIQTLLRTMWRDGIQSLLVEGGCQTLQSFIDAELWDEAYVETSPRCLNTEGTPAPRLHHATLCDTAQYDLHRIDEWHHYLSAEKCLS